MTVHEIEEVQLPEFLICALDGGGCQRHAPTALSEGKCSRYPLRGSWVSPIPGVTVSLTPPCQDIKPWFLALPATIMSERLIFRKPHSKNCCIN